MCWRCLLKLCVGGSGPSGAKPRRMRDTEESVPSEYDAFDGVLTLCWIVGARDERLSDRRYSDG